MQTEQRQNFLKKIIRLNIFKIKTSNFENKVKAK